jgi:uncharacterized membrane protein (DUF106 family)
MNTLLVITLVVAIPVYAWHWHNQPARAQSEKPCAIEAAFTFLFNPYWPTRVAARVAYWVASNILTKWQTGKIHAHSRAKI